MSGGNMWEVNQIKWYPQGSKHSTMGPRKIPHTMTRAPAITIRTRPSREAITGCKLMYSKLCITNSTNSSINNSSSSTDHMNPRSQKPRRGSSCSQTINQRH